MNRNINMFGRTIPVWFLLATMVGAGSFAIAVQGGAVHQEDPPSIQHTSDQKIHLQDVDGKVITNVPIMANRAFSPLPVEWDQEQAGDNDPNGATTGFAVVGTSIMTKQKLAINFVVDTAEDGTLDLQLDNRSEDPQIFLIKCDAPPHVQLDFEDPTAVGTDVDVHGLTGHNEWLASIAANGADDDLIMEVSVTDAGFYPIVCELLRVG
jgi:hypothetical protein